MDQDQKAMWWLVALCVATVACMLLFGCAEPNRFQLREESAHCAVWVGVPGTSVERVLIEYKGRLRTEEEWRMGKYITDTQPSTRTRR